MITTRPFRSAHGALGATGLCLLLAACGGGGGGDGSSGTPAGATPPTAAVGTPAPIDAAAMTKAIPEIARVVPICRQATAEGTPALKSKAGIESTWLSRLESIREMGAGRGLPTAKSLGPTKPADVLGECGGRRGYTSYSHSGGVTTGTLAFDNFCTTDSGTGERQVVNGSITFVNTGTPSASGPITSRVEASSPGGITMRVQTASGTVLSSQTAAFTNFLYTVGVPGGSPTAAQPDVMRVDEIRYTVASGQTYRQTDYVVTDWETADGGEQMTISGRGYRSNGDYFDVSTPTPVTSDASGRTTAGEIAIGGANGSKAVMTMVPGTRMQATMTVNGTPVTSVPVCQ